MYNIRTIVKLKDGRVVIIINTPNTFMSNGSYEVREWVDNGIGEFGNPFWVKSEEILYEIKKEFLDDINNYFEVIWDENGLNLIPKDFNLIDIESDRDDFNRIKISYDGGRTHKLVNIHIGDVKINDLSCLTVRPIKKKKNKLEKIINIIKDTEDEV